MKFLWKIILFLIFTALLYLAQVSVWEMLPSPINKINIIFLFFVLMSAFLTVGKFLWLIVPLAFYLEIYSSAPFGVSSLSFYLGVLFLNFILINFLTNRSAFTVFLSCLLGLLAFRVVYVVMLFTTDFFSHSGFPPNLLQVALSALLESVLSACLGVLFYLLVIFIIKKIRPGYLVSIEKIYRR